MLVLAGATAVVAGACNDEDNLTYFGELDCKHYCERKKDCVDNCIDNCIDNMSDCQADEQQDALDQFDACQDVACNDFTGCAIDAGLTCYFGL
jgi:hypothetical protein